MFTSRVAAVAALLLIAQTSAPAAAEKTTTFALIGDWGRAAGEGSVDYLPGHYDPTRRDACPSNPAAPFYISIDPTLDPSGGPHDKIPDDICVINACKHLAGDPQQNCQGRIQQEQGSWYLNNVCAMKGCEYIINTGDNFYISGCNKTRTHQGGTCEERFVTDWHSMYQSDVSPAIKDLVWYGSIGNHDILSNIEGVDEQIAYSKKNSKWVLPARYYAQIIGSGATQINLVVADTNCFIDGYLKPTSVYAATNEEQTCSTPAARTAQLDFLEAAMKAAVEQPGWFVVMAHHPGFGGSVSYFQDEVTGKPESSAWARFSDMVKKYKPVTYANGHDHTLVYSAKLGYATQFFTTGAGSISEPGDGGYNSTSGKVSTGKGYMRYSGVRMSDGASWAGHMISTVTANTFTTEIYSIRSGMLSEYKVVCKKTMGRKAIAPFTCTHGPGEAPPAYSA